MEEKSLKAQLTSVKINEWINLFIMFLVTGCGILMLFYLVSAGLHMGPGFHKGIVLIYTKMIVTVICTFLVQLFFLKGGEELLDREHDLKIALERLHPRFY